MYTAGKKWERRGVRVGDRERDCELLDGVWKLMKMADMEGFAFIATHVHWMYANAASVWLNQTPNRGAEVRVTVSFSSFSLRIIAFFSNIRTRRHTIGNKQTHRLCKLNAECVRVGEDRESSVNFEGWPRQYWLYRLMRYWLVARGVRAGAKGECYKVYQYAWVCESARNITWWLFAVVLIIFPPPL